MNPSTTQELYSVFLELAGTPALKEVDRAILVEVKRGQPVIGYWKLVGTLGLHEQRVLDSLQKLREKRLVFAHRDGWRLTPEGARIAREIGEGARIEINGGGKFRPGVVLRPPSKSFFLDLRLKNPFYADLRIRKPERLRRW